MKKERSPKDIRGGKKVDLTVIPPSALYHCAMAGEEGAYFKEYGLMNWREKPIEFRGILSAMQRHNLAIQDGEDVAPDSLVMHLAHIMMSAAIAIDALEHDTMIDNRAPGGVPDIGERLAEVKGIKLARKAAAQALERRRRK